MRVLRGPSHANHPAPVVKHEGDFLRQLRVADERVEVGDAAGEGEFVVRVVGLVREAAADVVGDDGAALPAQAEHELAVVEGPGRVAVDHHDGFARALIEVVQADAVAIEEVADKGIVFATEVHD